MSVCYRIGFVCQLGLKVIGDVVALGVKKVESVDADFTVIPAMTDARINDGSGLMSKRVVFHQRRIADLLGGSPPH